MCEDILNKSGVAILPGSDFGFKKSKMLARLSYTDFDGETFSKKIQKAEKNQMRATLKSLHQILLKAQKGWLIGLKSLIELKIIVQIKPFALTITSLN